MGTSAGCASSMYPRPADTTPAKHWAIEADLPLFAGSADQVRVHNPPGKAETQRGLGGNVDEVGGPMPIFVPEIIGRFGLSERWEVAAIVGPLRLAGETRWGIWAERRKNPVSIALAFAGGIQPFYDRTGPWLRGGVDLSARRGMLMVMTNLYVTYGRETHAFPLNLPSRPEDQLTTDGAAQHAQVTRREVRFLPSLALGTPIPSGYLMAGLVPWFVVHSEPADSMHCDGCLAGTTVSDFRETFGMMLVVGGAFRRGF